VDLELRPALRPSGEASPAAVAGLGLDLGEDGGMVLARERAGHGVYQGWPGRRAPPRSRLRGSFRTRRASDRGCTRQSRWRPRRASRRRAGLRRAGDGRPDPRRQGSHRRGRVPHRSGSEYTARAFRTACERIGIKQSMGRPGSALDKACVSHCTSSRELGISRACASKWVNRGAWDSSRPNAAPPPMSS
jgi:hypothetical protein